MRIWINIIILCFCTYGAWGVLNDALPSRYYNEFEYTLFMLSPWILAFGALKAWHLNFIWRRMLDHRHTAPILSRGEHRRKNNRPRPHILEHICAALFLFALAAILKQFEFNNITWLIGSLVFSWLCLRIVLMAVRRS